MRVRTNVREGIRDSSASGAWPFPTRGVICLANSDNAWDPHAEKLADEYLKVQEAGGDNRSVMPLDVLGFTRTTLADGFLVASLAKSG